MKNLILAVLAIFLCIGALSYLVRSCDDATEVAHKEFDASALLKKYEYFKNMSGAIDKYRADIDMYRSEISENDVAVKDKDDKFYLQQRKSELLGIISMHNALCSQYNTAMSKFNYRFTNVGDLPATNLQPLPREYKPYINNLKN